MNTSDEFRILSPTAILGYGFPEESFRRGVQRQPHLIACDAGSTDPGPYYLGSGKSFTNRALVKRDLQFMLVEGLRLGVPVVVGSAGGAGAAPHVAWCREIVAEIAREHALSFRMAVIHCRRGQGGGEGRAAGRQDPPPGLRPAADATRPSTHPATLSPRSAASRSCGRCRPSCQVVLAGRCYDPANFAALPIMLGYDPALALHLGKILECGAIAATPGSGADCVLGTLAPRLVRAGSRSIPSGASPAQSAAAHTLYEKSDPYHLPGPGGVLDLEDCVFTELGDGRVEVKGSRHKATTPYCVKLEGARQDRLPRHQRRRHPRPADDCRHRRDPGGGPGSR